MLRKDDKIMLTTIRDRQLRLRCGLKMPGVGAGHLRSGIY